MDLPCSEAAVPALLKDFGAYVARLQEQAREAVAEVARLRGEMACLQQEVDALRLQLQQAADREQGQAERIGRLSEQLSAAERSVEMATRAHEEQRQTADAQARKAEESCAQHARQLAHAEHRIEELAAEALQAHEFAQQRQQAQNAQQEAVEELQHLQAEMAEAQEQLLQQLVEQQQQQQQQQRQQQEAKHCGQGSSAKEVAELQQELAALQQQLYQERREKEDALEGKAKYKKQFREIGEAFRQTRNAYMRLRREKGINGTVHESALWPGRQPGSSGKLTPHGEDADPWQASAGSDREPAEPAAAQASGANRKQHASAGYARDLNEPADGQDSGARQQQHASIGRIQEPNEPASALASEGNREQRVSVGSGREPNEPAGPPASGVSRQQRGSSGSSRELAKQQAGSPRRGDSAPATSQQEGSTRLSQQSFGLGENLDPLANAADPASTGAAAQPGLSPEPAAPDVASAAKQLACASESAAPVGSGNASAAACQTGEPAGQDAQQFSTAAAGRAPEPLRPMNPPPPRPHVAAAAAGAGPAAAAGQQQADLAPVLSAPPCPSGAFEDPSQTQPDTFRPLHQLDRTPQTCRGLKRPPSVLDPAGEPGPAPAKQLTFDAAAAPTWGPAGGKAPAAAAAPLPAGPAWKKAARPSNPDQRGFNVGEGQPPTGPWPGQQQAAVQQPGQWLLGQCPAGQQQQQPRQQWQQSGADMAAGINQYGSGSGGYKYQEVVRKRDERQLLKAMECLHCQRFYEALQTWGTIDGAGQLPGCGHVTGRNLAGANGAPLVSRDELREAGSRHRFRYEPPATPDEFWNMGFGTGD